MSFSLSLMMSNKNADMKNQIDSATNNIKKYADQNDFINLRPSIGINGETQMPITINGLSVTIGYSGGTVIELGGYCSTFDQHTITLSPNKTNYIYLRRNASDRHKIDIDVRDVTIGAEGQMAFNFFMTGKFITDNSSVTSNVIYSVR